LDGFKSVNDTLGHQFGDELLKHVATRLRTCVRGSDTVARLGGDEFAVILEGIRTTNTATAVADKVIDAISAPFELAGQSLAISTSIGLVVYPDCGVEAAITRLYRCADDALYRTKQAGKNRYHLFTEQMGQHLLNRLQFEQDLKRAIAQDEFTVYYQPVVDACSGELVSLEALLRWRHPTLGVLAPGEFLSYLEDSGDIIAVGDSVIGAVCRQLRAWLDAGFPLVPVSINVSPRQLLNCGFADSLLQALSERALDPRLVAIELTENRLIEKSECVQIAVSRLHAAGVRFAIDDFGTGYSAYDYLRAFPVGTIKVHRRFIHKIASSKADRAIAESLIVLARRIGAEVVAKGVETDEQLRELRALDCDAVQGFLMASPSPAEKMERFLGRNGTVTGKRSQRASDRTAAGA
jgi:diguanylate cyclase (GGDEF)-like protein